MEPIEKGVTVNVKVDGAIKPEAIEKVVENIVLPSTPKKRGPKPKRDK